MPHYLYISIILLLGINSGYSQPDTRKFSTDKKAIEKMANDKTKLLCTYVKLNTEQQKLIKALYVTEVQKIDSLKYMPKEFYEDPQRPREVIAQIKYETEVQIKKLLTPQQYHELIANRDKYKKEALRKLHSKNKQTNN